MATLASQFFLIWLFNKVPWFTNYASSGTITAPPRSVLGVMVTGPQAAPAARYLVALALVAVFALVAKNLVRGRVGRAWMAIRDRDIAAEIIGIRPLRTKLLAFAISSFYCGVAGAELVFLYLGSAETQAFDINISFLVLFMVIIGGLGSILGSFLGAAFIVLVPIFLTNAPHLMGFSAARGPAQADRADDLRGPHRPVPDRRTAWSGPTVASREGEAAPVALSLI